MEITPEVCEATPRIEILDEEESAIPSNVLFVDFVKSRDLEYIVSILKSFDDGFTDLSLAESKEFLARQSESVDSAYAVYSLMEVWINKLSADIAKLKAEQDKCKSAFERFKAFLKEVHVKYDAKELRGSMFSSHCKASRIGKSHSQPTTEHSLSHPSCVETSFLWSESKPTQEMIDLIFFNGLEDVLLKKDFKWKRAEAKAVVEKDPAAFDGAFSVEISYAHSWKPNKNPSTTDLKGE